jgi:hypothetical protein
VDDYWAAERTHEDAKTIAMAASFVDEAFNFVNGLRREAQFHGVFKDYDRQITAGLHIFAARRLIDSGKPKDALGHFRQAWEINPKAVMRVWYKWVQAVGGTLGLGGLFLWYRSTRRRLQHHKRHLVVDERGIHWADLE